jgi:hypothetical protein
MEAENVQCSVQRRLHTQRGMTWSIWDEVFLFRSNYLR